MSYKNTLHPNKEAGTPSFHGWVMQTEDPYLWPYYIYCGLSPHDTSVLPRIYFVSSSVFPGASNDEHWFSTCAVSHSFLLFPNSHLFHISLMFFWEKIKLEFLRLYPYLSNTAVSRLDREKTYSNPFSWDGILLCFIRCRHNTPRPADGEQKQHIQTHTHKHKQSELHISHVVLTICYASTMTALQNISPNHWTSGD